MWPDNSCKILSVKRDNVIATLRAHEAELRRAGVVSLSIFGSVARGRDQPDSDVDVVVRLSNEASRGGFAYFGRLATLSARLESILDRPVDLVTEPVRKDRLRDAIERDRARAF